MMSYVSVDNLKQGMVLSEDVRDINTRLLLSKGQKLAPNHIRVLKIWGVSEVKIVGAERHAISTPPVLDSHQIEGIKNEIALVYKQVNLNNTILNEICKTTLVYRLRRGFVPPSIPDPKLFEKHEQLARPELIRQEIQKIEAQLPEAPTIITELNQVMADPFATSNDVAQVVNKSPSLAAILLKIVNSAYYGFPSKIDRISRAVTIIGTKEISGLALGISVMQAFHDIPKEIIDMSSFIRHSLACGMISRILAALNNMAQTEQLFVSGLLHDIGKLIVFKYFPDYAQNYIGLAISSGDSVYNSEKRIMGMNHAQIGKYLLKKWKLPENLESNIIYHHHPTKAQDIIQAGIVHLADLIVHGLGIGSSGEYIIPCFDSVVLEKTGISCAKIQMVIRQAVHHLGAMEAIFDN